MILFPCIWWAIYGRTNSVAAKMNFREPLHKVLLIRLWGFSCHIIGKPFLARVNLIRAVVWKEDGGGGSEAREALGTVHSRVDHMPARQDGGPRRRAHWLCVVFVEHRSTPSEGHEVGRGNLRVAMHLDVVPAEVICQHEDDVRRAAPTGSCRAIGGRTRGGLKGAANTSWVGRAHSARA